MSAFQFSGFSWLRSGTFGVVVAICSARISFEAATSTWAPLTVLLYFCCSAVSVDALNSARLATACSWACWRVVRSSARSVPCGETSAAYRMARCTATWFSFRSRAPSVVTSPCRSASLAPAPMAALNVFAGVMRLSV